MIRVLVTTAPTAFLHQGGGEREIHLLNEALNSVGIFSDIYGSDSLPLESHDIVIHFSMLGGSESLVDEAFDAGRHLVLWPNLWFVTKPSVEQLAHLLRFLSRFDAVVFKSEAEERHFAQYFNLEGKKIVRVSPLISPRFFRTDIGDLFRETHGIDRYAIWPGIIEPQKNQLAAIRAFRDIDMELVITGAVRDRAYFEECKRLADSNVHFFPPMQFGSELHLSALKNSQFFVELPLDFPGTSAIEASILGCSLLVTRCDWCSEFFGESCVQVDVGDEAAIHSTLLDLIISSRFQSANSQRQGMSEAIAPLTSYLHEIAGKR